MKFTVLGSTGFIGGAMAQYLRARGHDVDTPARDTTLKNGNAGHVIYAIGLTGDFRTRPYDAIEAHVNVLHRLIDKADFESWLYLSSTRVYGALPPGAATDENAAIPVRPGLDSLYDISKLLGESLCMARDNPAVRVARLSNVYGTGQSPHTFLGSVLQSCAATGAVTLREGPESSKDYIAIGDVTARLEHIALHGTERIYNVAHGTPFTHAALADALRKAGCRVDFTPGAPVRAFPVIDTGRIDRAYTAPKHSLADDISSLIKKESSS